MQSLPTGLDDVAGPLREAEGYERLQLERQRGVYNILTGLPGLFFALMWFGSPWPAVAILAWPLFLFSCYTPKLLVPFVRHHRPDWEAAFLAAPLLKRALEKQFWLQAPFYMLGFVVPMLATVALVTSAPQWQMAGLGAVAWMRFAIHVAGTATLALQARKAGDRMLASQFWAMTAMAPAAFLPPHALSPAGLGIFAFALMAPPVLTGLFRLVAPRRWLVR